MSPFIPHFTAECLNNLDQKQIAWPKISKKGTMVEEVINFVVQINGKKRALLKVKRDTDEAEILIEIKSNNETKKYLKDQKIH